MPNLDPLAFVRDFLDRGRKAQAAVDQVIRDLQEITCPRCGWTGNIESQARHGYHWAYNVADGGDVEPTAFCPKCDYDFC